LAADLISSHERLDSVIKRQMEDEERVFLERMGIRRDEALGHRRRLDRDREAERRERLNRLASARYHNLA
jgi:hypothetical protein